LPQGCGGQEPTRGSDLLDTNILSELRRPKPERKVLAFIAAHPLEQLYVSTVTFAEIRFGH
jgi:predicted nucleic acid-binding protein